MGLLWDFFSRSNHNFFGLRFYSVTISIKALRTVLPFLSFKGLTHAYLVKTSMAHNKYLTFFFLEDNDSDSVKYAAQMFSLNLGHIFLF